MSKHKVTFKLMTVLVVVNRLSLGAQLAHSSPSYTVTTVSSVSSHNLRKIENKNQAKNLKETV